MAQDKAVQEFRKPRDDQQAGGRDLGHVIAQERAPALGRRATPVKHVLGHGGLGGLDAELEELAMEAQGTPERIGLAHLTDQGPDFGRDLRPTAA